MRNGPHRTVEPGLSEAPASARVRKIILTGSGGSRILILLGGKILTHSNLVSQGLAFVAKDTS